MKHNNKKYVHTIKRINISQLKIIIKIALISTIV